MKAGLVGVGFIGTVHAESLHILQKEGMIEFAGIYDKDENRCVKASKKWNVKAFKSYDELLENTDVVVLAVPTHVRRDMIVKALEKNKHVFSEKPIARNLEDGKEILKEYKKSGVKFMVGHVLRYFPEYEMIRDMILSKDIGDVVKVRCFRGSYIPTWGEWFRDFEKSGGVILDLAIHEIDYWLWILGDVENILARSISFGKNMKYDYAQILLKFKCGALAHIEGAWVNAPSYPFRYVEEVTGTKASIHFDSLTSTPVWIYKSEISSVYPYEISPYTKMMKEFILWIKEDKKPRIDPESALKTLDITLKIMKSSYEKRELKVGDYDE